MSTETREFDHAAFHGSADDELVIRFNRVPPEFPHTPGRDGLARMYHYYGGQGKQLADALLAHLPGGLLDGLLVALLDHKRSLFRVPHGLCEPEGGES